MNATNTSKQDINTENKTDKTVIDVFNAAPKEAVTKIIDTKANIIA